MNFKLVALVTLIGVSLTVRGDAPCYRGDANNNIVINKNVTPQQFVQELIDMKSLWQARETINALSYQDRHEVRKALQEKLLLWIAEHGSRDSLRTQRQGLLMGREDQMMPAILVGAGSLVAGIELFNNIRFPKHETNLYDVGGIFKKLDMKTPNQKLATVVIASTAMTAMLTIIGCICMRNIDTTNTEISKKNLELEDKIHELNHIQSLLEYCAS